MPLGDIVKATIVYTLHGQELNNVLHFRASTNLATLQQLATEILDCIRTTLLPGMSPQVKIAEVRAKTLWPTATDEIVVAALTTDVGSGGAESLPSFNAGVVSIKTGLAGRSKRGRFYIGGIPENGHENSRMTNAELGHIVAFATCLATKFISSSSAIPWLIGVLSRKIFKATGNAGNAFTGATVMTIHDVLGTQRRRKLGVGS